MKTNEIINKIENKWNNVYWLARMLINNDKYVAIGKDSKLLSTLASTLRVIAKENYKTKEDEILKLQLKSITNILEERYKKSDTLKNRLKNLLIDLEKELKSLSDIEVFILTCENIMIPLNQAIANIPNDDKEYTVAIAKSYLDIQKEKGLATVINLWDDLGVKGCLTAERIEIVRAFTTLRILMTKDKQMLIEDQDVILTAFTQEFERRAAQKRKKRAGTSLEDVTSFILNYYNIISASAPEHFQSDIEVDNWVKTNDGWLIGISCKRTLRERWKQVSSAESTILSKYKIKQIFHVVTFDEDLSDDKIVTLGANRHIFYLPDKSRILKHAQEHVGLKDYIRPISNFISDLKKETK